ncbi:uncharacterized protein FN964_010203 [Alca torda]
MRLRVDRATQRKQAASKTTNRKFDLNADLLRINAGAVSALAKSSLPTLCLQRFCLADTVLPPGHSPAGYLTPGPATPPSGLTRAPPVAIATRASPSRHVAGPLRQCLEDRWRPEVLRQALWPSLRLCGLLAFLLPVVWGLVDFLSGLSPTEVPAPDGDQQRLRWPSALPLSENQASWDCDTVGVREDQLWHSSFHGERLGFSAHLDARLLLGEVKLQVESKRAVSAFGHPWELGLLPFYRWAKQGVRGPADCCFSLMSEVYHSIGDTCKAEQRERTAGDGATLRSAAVPAAASWCTHPRPGVMMEGISYTDPGTVMLAEQKPQRRIVPTQLQ